MTSLALNTTITNYLKFKYIFWLGLLPMAGLFLLLGIVVLYFEYAGESSLDGWLAISVFVVTIFGSMFAGYLFGWKSNALIKNFEFE